MAVLWFSTSVFSTVPGLVVSQGAMAYKKRSVVVEYEEEILALNAQNPPLSHPAKDEIAISQGSRQSWGLDTRLRIQIIFPGQITHKAVVLLEFAAICETAPIRFPFSEGETPDLERQLTTFFAVKVAPSDTEKPLY